MVDVDKFSDSELRTKLSEFGFPMMPITDTTRKVMVKKLKLLLDNQGKSNSSERRSLGRFSSDEESDAELKLSKKEKSRRATMAVPPMQQPKTKTVETQHVNVVLSDMDPPATIITREKRKSSGRTTKITVHVSPDDTNSDSEPEIVETTYKTDHKRDSPAKPPSPIKKKTPPEPISKPSENITSRMNTSTSSSTSRYSSYVSPRFDSNDELNKIRSRLSLSNRYDYLPTSSLKTSDDDDQPTPFLSNFTRNLSQKPDLGTSDFGRSDPIKEYDINTSSKLHNRSAYLSRPKSREYSRTIYDANAEEKGGKTNVSLILMALAALFFIVLAALYYGMHSGVGSGIEGLAVPYCKPGRADHCLSKTEANGAVEILKIIQPLLTAEGIRWQCESHDKFYMTDEDIIAHIRSNYKSIEEWEVNQDIDYFIILVFHNPHLGISVLQSENDEFPASSMPVNTIEQYAENAKQDYKRALAVLNPSLPWMCNLVLRLTGLARGIFIIFAIASSLWLVRYGYKWYNYYQQRSKEEIILMVERILDFVESSAAEENCLVINHVRDMLIPVNNRKKMESTWKKAVAFIAENESRIRTEVQTVKGEHYEVWRWVGGFRACPRGAKSWQGQAFETQAGSQNSPPTSPSACLKIRGMIDEGDRNLQTIREAVLTKCPDACRILHCTVDAVSKCVHMKCASPADASLAYQNLHGWWYAGHLVTAKYLRDERYMQRFPDSPNSGPPYLRAHGRV